MLRACSRGVKPSTPQPIKGRSARPIGGKFLVLRLPFKPKLRRRTFLLRRSEVDAEGLTELHELFLFPRIDEDERGPFFTGPSGATAAVSVVVDLLRKLVMDHEREAFDIDTTGGDISRDEELGAFFFEGAHHFVTLKLGEITLENANGVAGVAKLFPKDISSISGAGKNEATFIALTVEEFVNEVGLVLFDTDGVAVVDVTVDDVLGVDFDRFGVGRHAELDEVADDVRESGGKEPGGFARFGEIDGFFDLILETHGEHFVGFIKNEVLHGIKRDSLALKEVVKASGSGDKNVGGPLEAGNLDLDFVAPGNHFEENAFFGILGEFEKGLVNLFRKLAGRGEDEDLNLFLFGIDLGEQRQPKSSGFSSASLGLGHEVESLFHEVGNGFLLNRGGFVDAQFLEALDKVGGNAEGFKIAHSSSGLIAEPEKAKPTD